MIPPFFRPLLLAIAATLALGACSKSSEGPVQGAPAGAKATGGGALYAQNCQKCHGPGATGSEFGPPLVHKIYEPNHHPDAAFYRAALTGVRTHHWQFGNMPAIPGVTSDDVAEIIAYVRGLQREAGIY